jgi:cytochrome c553
MQLWVAVYAFCLHVHLSLYHRASVAAMAVSCAHCHGNEDRRLITSRLAKKVPELVRAWLATLFPESLSATIDFSMLPFA